MRRTNPLITLHQKRISEGVLDESRLVREDGGFKDVFIPFSPYFLFNPMCRTIPGSSPGVWRVSCIWSFSYLILLMI